MGAGLGALLFMGSGPATADDSARARAVARAVATAESCFAQVDTLPAVADPYFAPEVSDPVFGYLIEGTEVLNSLTPRDPAQNPDYEGDRVITIVVEES